MGADVSFERKNENASNPTHGSLTGSPVCRPQGLVFRAAALPSQTFLLGRASSYSEAERDITNHLRFGRTEFYVTGHLEGASESAA